MPGSREHESAAPVGAEASAEAQARETHEWIESLDWVLHSQGPARVRDLLRRLQNRAVRRGVTIPFSANTPYVNTIPPEEQPPYPGDREIERRIKSIIRWNAMAMVVRANRARAASAGTSRPTPRRPRSTKSASTTSSAATATATTATWSSSRATARRASTRGRSWRAG